MEQEQAMLAVLGILSEGRMSYADVRALYERRAGIRGDHARGVA